MAAEPVRSSAPFGWTAETGARVVTAVQIAVDAVFNDPNIAVDAIWTAAASGTPVTVRAIVQAADQATRFDMIRVQSETLVLDVRVSEMAAPVEGDVIEVLGEMRVIQGLPERDARRLIWSIDTVGAA